MLFQNEWLFFSDFPHRIYFVENSILGAYCNIVCVAVIAYILYAGCLFYISEMSSYEKFLSRQARTVKVLLILCYYKNIILCKMLNFQ